MAWERQRFPELLQNPLARRVRGRVEVQNAPPMILDDEEAVQHAETHVGTVNKKAAITSR